MYRAEIHWLVISFGLIDYWLFYLTPFVLSFLTPSNLLASSLSVKAAKELQKEGRERDKDTFQHKLYFRI